MKTTLIILSSLSLLITSCGNEQNQQLSGIEQEVLEATEAEGLKAEDFIGKIDELLTLEMAAEVAGLPANSAEKDYSKISSLESLKYEWESDCVKKVSINGQSLNVPLANSIELSWVKNTTMTYLLLSMIALKRRRWEMIIANYLRTKDFPPSKRSMILIKIFMR